MSYSATEVLMAKKASLAEFSGWCMCLNFAINTIFAIQSSFRIVCVIALFIAVEKFDLTSLQMLLQSGVDTTLRDKVSEERSQNCLINY